MRSLRYWLGLPLYNILLWLFFFVGVPLFSLVLEITEDVSDDTIGSVITGSIFIAPLLTALYYPVRREDCRPLHKTVLISFAAIWGACILTGLPLALIPSFDGFYLFAFSVGGFILALIETFSYSLGLVTALGINAVAERIRERRRT